MESRGATTPTGIGRYGCVGLTATTPEPLSTYRIAGSLPFGVGSGAPLVGVGGAGCGAWLNASIATMNIRVVLNDIICLLPAPRKRHNRRQLLIFESEIGAFRVLTRRFQFGQHRRLKQRYTNIAGRPNVKTAV